VRLHSRYGKLIFVIISPFFAIFKNVVHSLEPGEPGELLGVSPGSKLCSTFLNISKRFGAVAVRLRLFFQFTYVQYCTSISRVRPDLDSSVRKSIIYTHYSTRLNVVNWQYGVSCMMPIFMFTSSFCCFL